MPKLPGSAGLSPISVTIGNISSVTQLFSAAYSRLFCDVMRRSSRAMTPREDMG